MEFELSVLCLHQETVSRFRKGLRVIVKNELEDGNPRYRTIWPFLNQTRGILYHLGVFEGSIYTASPLYTIYFDAEDGSFSLPDWIRDSEYLQPMFLESEYQEEIREILLRLIEDSPQKMILFHTRGILDRRQKEIIEGVIPFEIFWTLMLEERLLANVCYIIRSSDT